LEGEGDNVFSEGRGGSVLGFDDGADASLKGVGEGGFVGDEGSEEVNGGGGNEDVLATSMKSDSKGDETSCTVREEGQRKEVEARGERTRIEHSPLRSAGYHSSSKGGESLSVWEPPLENDTGGKERKLVKIDASRIEKSKLSPHALGLTLVVPHVLPKLDLRMASRCLQVLDDL